MGDCTAYAAASVLTVMIAAVDRQRRDQDASIVDVFWGPLFVAIAWVLLAVDLHRAVGGKHLLVVLLLVRCGVCDSRFTSRRATSAAARTSATGCGAPTAARIWWLKTFYPRLFVAGCDRARRRDADRRGVFVTDASLSA